MIKEFKKNLHSAAATILPIVFIVQIITLIIPVDTGVLVSFLLSSVLLIFGSALFTFGSELSMELIGNKIGKDLVKSKKIILILVVGFIIGTVVTIAEPDLLVLAEQLTSIPSWLLILIISIGVGLCVMLAGARSLFGWDLNMMLIIGFIAIFIFHIYLCFFNRKSFGTPKRNQIHLPDKKIILYIFTLVHIGICHRFFLDFCYFSTKIFLSKTSLKPL